MKNNTQKTLPDSEQKKIAAKWGKERGDFCIWTFPPVWGPMIRTVYGEEYVNCHADNPNWALDIFIEKHLSTRAVERALSFCCGFGKIERHLARVFPAMKFCLGMDISTGAIAGAREEAARAGFQHRVQYDVADLNRTDWAKENSYDLIVANGALHHLVNLEGVFEGIRASLKPGGWFYSFECVGPNLMDHPVRQVELINAMIHALPPELRRRPSTPFTYKHTFLRKLWLWKKLVFGEIQLHDIDGPTWTLGNRIASRLGRSRKAKAKAEALDFGIVYDSQKKMLLKTDPSEGVRSQDIIPVMRRFFPEAEVRPCGGALLAYVMDRAFYDNFDVGNPYHREVLDLLYRWDIAAQESGEIGIEYAALAAQKPQLP